jgi:hypothetical protein
LWSFSRAFSVVNNHRIRALSALRRRSQAATAAMPPAEADLRRHFGVTAPSVHQMALALEKAGTRAQSRSQHPASGLTGSVAYSTLNQTVTISVARH